MTSKAYGLAGLAFMLLLVSMCSGCAATVSASKVAYSSINWRESVSSGELTVQYPKGKLHDNGAYWLSAPGEQWRYHARN